MRVHCFQHVPFEGLGSMEPWLTAQGHEITYTRFFEADRLPARHDMDLLIVMGGPMSVNDEDRLTWLSEEKKFIRESIARGQRVLGICLGAQLIASALGAQVYKNPVKEIGWFPVQGLSGDDESLFRFPAVFEAFHWHGETFALPPGAIQIARSAGCENQAFQLGSSVIGLQFHLEMTPEAVRALVAHGRDELVPDQYVQSLSVILDAATAAYHTSNRLMAEVLAFLLNH